MTLVVERKSASERRPNPKFLTGLKALNSNANSLEKGLGKLEAGRDQKDLGKLPCHCEGVITARAGVAHGEGHTYHFSGTRSLRRMPMMVKW